MGNGVIDWFSIVNNASAIYKEEWLQRAGCVRQLKIDLDRNNNILWLINS